MPDKPLDGRLISNAHDPPKAINSFSKVIRSRCGTSRSIAAAVQVRVHSLSSGASSIARVKGPDRRISRLLCILEREAPGLAGASLVVLNGMSKPIGTAFSDSEYRRIRRRRDDHLAQVPRRVLL